MGANFIYNKLGFFPLPENDRAPISMETIKLINELNEFLSSKREMINVDEMNIDFLSLSGHKIGAPKGVGALYVRKGFPLVNVIEGGAQERGKRAGTENIAGICSMAAAMKDACDHLDENMAKVRVMRDRLIEGLK